MFSLGPAAFILFIVAIIALVTVGIVLGSRAKKKRQMALSAWAAGRGWHYTPDEVSSLEHRFPNFSVFQQGDNRYGYNVMRGDLGGRTAWGFDYHYETYSTDSKGNRQTHHHHFSAIIVDSGLQLTPLTLRGEGMFDRMKGLFGFDDIDFESAEFSRKFWVTSPVKRWAYDVLHQETMELLLESPRYEIEFEAGVQARISRGKRFKPHEFGEALELVTGVLQRIPKDIRARLQA